MTKKINERTGVLFSISLTHLGQQIFEEHLSCKITCLHRRAH